MVDIVFSIHTFLIIQFIILFIKKFSVRGILNKGFFGELGDPKRTYKGGRGVVGYSEPR
jgi:hypothetical protein